MLILHYSSVVLLLVISMHRLCTLESSNLGLDMDNRGRRKRTLSVIPLYLALGDESPS